jgi:predicted nucleic acid-binding protein
MRHFWTIEVRLVVDTNVRMAAELAFPKGRSPAAQLLQLLHKKFYNQLAGRQQRVTIVLLRSTGLQNELRDVLRRLGIPTEEIAVIVYEASFFSKFVDVTEEDIDALRVQAPLEAHDDIHVIACAIKGKATHIVTYDKRHLLTPEAKRFMRRYGIKVVTPAEMLDELRRLGDP